MKFLKELQDENNAESNDEINAEEDLSSLGTLKSFKPIEETGEDGDGEDKNENKNRQGLIRTVKGAHLIYKHQNETDRYDELWVYRTKNSGVLQDLDIKNDIISGTDIPLNSSKSEDGEQEYEIWHSGDTAFLKILNLPN